MGFPTSPSDEDEYTTILGTVYKYRLSDDCWYIINEELDLDGLGDVVIDGTPADHELLAWDNGTSKWINMTATEAGITIHTEDHDNAHHTTNYLANVSEDASPQIKCDGNLGSDHTFEGLVMNNITNAQAFGLLVYITSAHTTALCDKDSIEVCVGISVGTGEVLYSGTIRDDSFSGLAAGNPVFVGDSGAPTDDISGYTTGDMVQCIGVAIDTNVILIKDICWVEIV